MSSSLRLVFVIDKHQTLQTIVGVLTEAVTRGHSCDLYSTHDMCEHLDVSVTLRDVKNIVVAGDGSRGKMLRAFIDRKHDYDAAVSINAFNDGWVLLHRDSGIRTFALEHCWNELYNARPGLSCASTLFANSQWTLETMKLLSGYENMRCVGSPWFEFMLQLSERSTRHSVPGYAVFMAPHDSFLWQDSSYHEWAKRAAIIVRRICDAVGMGLILKTREKFTREKFVHTDTLASVVKFDGIVSDGKPLEHLTLYRDAQCVFHFCSSAVNELAFLSVPYVCFFTQQHNALHEHTRHSQAIQAIHREYYDGDIHKHGLCMNVEREELDAFGSDIEQWHEFVRSAGSTDAASRWDEFRSRFFPGEHIGASARVVDEIEASMSR